MLRLDIPSIYARHRKCRRCKTLLLQILLLLMFTAAMPTEL